MRSGRCEGSTKKSTSDSLLLNKSLCIYTIAMFTQGLIKKTAKAPKQCYFPNEMQGLLTEMRY